MHVENTFASPAWLKVPNFTIATMKECQAAKNENESLISKKIEEEGVRELSVDSGKRTFFKDAFFYLCMAFPIYLLSSLLIADVGLRSFGFLSLIALATCVQVFIVIYNSI